jgi:N-acetylglucosaminyldiphosphoundecaprenol N-acetyl-beta-D-mannosaminyltransferase
LALVNETLVIRPRRISVLGLPVDLFTVQSFIDFLSQSAQLKRKTVVGYANIHAANLSHDNQWYRDFMNRADAVFCDGIGLVLGAKLLGNPIHRSHRTTGPEFFEGFVWACERMNVSLYLLAGKPGIVDAAIQRLHHVAPSVEINGHHGYFEKTGPENEAIIQDINSKRPGILFIGLGSPIQEKWILDNLDRTDARVFLPFGAGLDYYTGSIPRGPRWLTNYGGEWLCRLVLEPRRLWKRYLIGNPLFFGRIFAQLLARTVGWQR